MVPSADGEPVNLADTLASMDTVSESPCFANKTPRFVCLSVCGVVFIQLPLTAFISQQLC